MNGRIAAVAVVLGLLGASVPAATRVYFVEPKELHEGTVAGDAQHGIRQTFVANVDSVAYIEWFVGELSAEGQYSFEIREQGTNDLVCAGAESVPARGGALLDDCRRD
jgi:hypothetical protein